MALSAVLSLIVLVIVQLNKVVKEQMGKLVSRDAVTPLGSASHKEKGEGHTSDKSIAEGVVTKGEKRVKWADVRKRRPSNAGFVDLSLTSTTPITSPVDLSPITQDSPDPDKPSPSFTWETNTKQVRNRQSRVKSATRVSPDSVPSPTQNGPGRDPNEWAMVTPWNMKSVSKPNQGGRKSSTSDGALSPSACHVNVLSPTEQTKPIQKSSVFANDMEAYDIW